MMEYKVLNDGNKIPVVGFGTFRLSGQECIDATYNAIKLGYRLIDTAESYQNEAEVGYAIAQCISEGIVTREELFITTKLSHHVPNSYEKTYKQFEGSLKRLGLDYVDLYLIHYPNVTPDARWKAMNAEDYRAMEELQEAGKIKSIGVSNFLQCHLKELLKTAKIKPVVNQLNLNPTWPQEELVKYCFERDIACEAWAPLVIVDNDNQEIMNRIAAKYRKSTAQISLRWSLQKGFIPISKTKHIERLQENLNIFDFNIADKDMQELDTLISHSFANNVYPDATYTLWSLYEQLRNKTIKVTTKFKLFNFFSLLKYYYYQNEIKISLFGFIPLIKKVTITDNKAKVYLFNVIRIGTEFTRWKRIAVEKLVPKWDQEEPKEKLIRWNPLENRYFHHLNHFINTYSEEKVGTLYPYYLKLRYFLTGKISIPHLDVHITTHCNIACRDCSHYIPYYKKEDHYIMSLEEYKGYIDSILKNVDRIYYILLLGGEPFLHRKLLEFVDYSCLQKKIQNVYIVTNGTLLLSENVTVELTKYKNLCIIISNYAVNKEIAVKQQELINILQKNRIKYIVDDNFKWYRQPEINLENKVTDPIVLKNNFYKCDFKNHVILGKGKIYPCAQAKYIETLAYDMPKDSYIDLNKDTLKKDDFINFYKKDCFKVCECCDMTHYGEVLFPAIQIKNNLNKSCEKKTNLQYQHVKIKY